MTKHILTKGQRADGLRTHEDDHNLYLYDIAKPDKFIAIFNATSATIVEIQKEANEYLIKRGR